MTESSSPRLVLVKPTEDHAVYHGFLSSEEGMDKVHRLPEGQEHEELLTKRLGMQDHNKRTYALVGDNMQVLSVIYTLAANVPQAEETWKMLPGKIDTILDEPSKPVDYDPSVIVFYSISAFGKGAGRSLIKALYKEFKDATHTPILTTLSPLRTFGAWMDGKPLTGSDEAKTNKVVEYLKTKANPVQNFHLGNGAQVGAIHFNVSSRTLDATEGAGVMISYRYPRREERLEENLGILAAGRIPSSYHLAPLFK